MTAGQRAVALGAVLGAVGVLLALACAVRPGGGGGAALGLALGAAAGAAGAAATAAAVAARVRARLGGATGAGPEIRDLDGLLDRVEADLRQAGDAADESEGVGRSARVIWEAVRDPSGGPPPPSAGPGGWASAVFGVFREAAAALVRDTAALEEANERTAAGALDQSATVARTANTVEALSDKIDRVSRNAGDATEACDRTRQEARRGLEQVHRVVEGMDRLRARAEANGRKARRLGDRSVEIGTIVELIRGVSGRTDMLALNATIESVRAGEHGRGFAVVAEEIRKLAERTAAATREIGTLVEAIQADTHESVRALAEEQAEMEQEAQRVRDAGAALERIREVADESAELVDGISRSSHDQVVAAQDLVRAMQRISDVSQLTLERTTRSRESIRGLARWRDRLAPLSTAPAATPIPVPVPAVEDPPTAVAPPHRQRRSVGSGRVA